jgi:hypothetical protein
MAFSTAVIPAIQKQVFPITKVTPVKKASEMEQEQSKLYKKLSPQEQKDVMFPELAKQRQEQQRMAQETARAEQETAAQQQTTQLETMKFEASIAEMERKARVEELAIQTDTQARLRLEDISTKIATEGINEKNVKEIYAYGLQTGNKDIIDAVDAMMRPGATETITPNRHFGNLLAKESKGETLTEIQKVQLNAWYKTNLPAKDATSKLEYETAKHEKGLQAKHELYKKLREEYKQTHEDAMLGSGLMKVGSPGAAKGKAYEAEMGEKEARLAFYNSLLAQGYSKKDAKELSGLGQTNAWDIGTTVVTPLPQTPPSGVVTPGISTPGAKTMQERFDERMRARKAK